MLHLIAYIVHDYNKCNNTFILYTYWWMIHQWIICQRFLFLFYLSTYCKILKLHLQSKQSFQIEITSTSKNYLFLSPSLIKFNKV